LCWQVISDLLKPERQNLVIREDRKRGVFVEGLSEWVVRSPAEVTSYKLFKSVLLAVCGWQHYE
jgi:hypothetical protein